MEKKLDIVIRSKAENEGFESVATQIERQIGKLKALNKDYAELDAKLTKVRQAQAQWNATQGPTKGAVTGWDSVSPEVTAKNKYGAVNAGVTAAALSRSSVSEATKSSGMLAAAAGMLSTKLAALGSGFMLASHALKEYTTEQNNLARLDTALAQRAQLSDQYRSSLHALAEELRQATAIDEDKWLSVLTILTQAGADSGNINKLSEAVKNLAGILGGDIEQAAMVMGKALNGSYTPLKKLGIAIKEGMAPAEALSVIYKELALRGGGQLEALATTTQGKFSAIKNSFGDFFKSVGRTIFDSEPIQNLGTSVGWLAEKMADAANWFEKHLNTPKRSLEGLKNAAIETKVGLLDLADSHKEAAKAADSMAQAEKKLNDILNQRKSLIEQKENAEIEKLGAQRDLTKVQLAAMKSKGFVNAADMKALGGAGLLSPAMRFNAMMNRGKVDEAFWLNAEFLAEKKYRDDATKVREKSAKETEKVYKDQKAVLVSRRNSSISDIEQAEARKKTAAEIDKLDAEAKEYRRKAGEMWKEFQTNQKPEYYQMAYQSFNNLSLRAYHKEKQAAELRKANPNIGTQDAETQKIINATAQKNKLDSAIGEFSNEMNSTVSQLRAATEAMKEIAKITNNIEFNKTQTEVNDSIFQKLKQQQAAINGLK